MTRGARETYVAPGRRLAGQVVLLVASVPGEESGADGFASVEEAAAGVSRAVAASGGRLAVLGDAGVAALVALAAAEYRSDRFIEGTDAESGGADGVVEVFWDEREEGFERAALEDLQAAGALRLTTLTANVGDLASTVSRVLRPGALLRIGRAVGNRERFDALRRGFPDARAFVLVDPEGPEDVVHLDRALMRDLAGRTEELTQRTPVERFNIREDEEVFRGERAAGAPSESPAGRLWTPNVVPFALVASLLVRQLEDGAFPA